MANISAQIQPAPPDSSSQMKDVFNTPYPYLFLLAIFFLILFRKQIAKLIDRTERGKASKSGFEFVSPIPSTVETLEAGGSQESVPKKEDEKEKVIQADPQAEQVPMGAEEYRSEMIFSFLMGKKDKAEESYAELVKLNLSPYWKKKDHISYLKFSYGTGNTEAIPELKKYLKDETVLYEANSALGYCYSESDDYVNASFYYSEAVKNAKSEEDKATSSRNYASSLYKNSEKDKAVEILIENLSTTEDLNSKVILYEALANIYKQEKDYKNRALVLDKALEIKPNDAGLLFDAAYAYSQANYEELSLLHYKSAASIDEKNSNVQNNLGVQYERLKMPINSVSRYKKSELLGNTLSNANLGYQLIYAGFIDEAKIKLDEAKNKEDPHPNVSKALADISKQQEEESESEKKHIKNGLAMRRFFLGYAQAKFNNTDCPELLNSEWISEDKTIYKVSVINGKIIATWSRERYGYVSEYKLEGELFNSSAEVVFYKKEYAASLNEKVFEKKEDGFVFYSKDDGSIKIMGDEYSSAPKSSYTLKRVVGC